MLTKKFSFLLTLVMALGLVIVGCSDDDDNNPMVSNPTTSIRVIHASHDAPDVDVRIDGSVAISGLAYGESSGYAEIGAGTRSVEVTPSGATSPVVISADLTLDDNESYTVYAVNVLGSIEPIVSLDDFFNVSGQATIRFIHASPDAPSVDIKLNDGTGPVVFANASFKDITPYLAVEDGNYTFAVTPANSEQEVIIFDPITVSPNNIYTVVANGTLDPNDSYDFNVRVFIDSGNGDAYADLEPGFANVLVTHASPDAPGVDLVLDNTVVNSSALTFPLNTGYLDVLAGTRNVKVNASGTSTSVIEADLRLLPNTDYSVFAVNTLSSIEALVLADDLTSPAAGNSHVRFIHLSPDAPAVDITLTDGTIVFGNKAFKEYSEFTPLPAGTYDLQVRVAGTETVALELPGIVLQSGKIYTVFAKGFLNGSGGQALGAEIIVNN